MDDDGDMDELCELALKLRPDASAAAFDHLLERWTRIARKARNVRCPCCGDAGRRSVTAMATGADK